MEAQKSGTEDVRGNDRPGRRGEREMSAGQGNATALELARAYSDFIGAQRDIQMQSQRRCQDAYMTMMNTLTDANMAACKPLEEAYQILIVASANAGLGEEAWQQYQAALQQQQAAVSEFMNNNELQEACQRAYMDYFQACADASREAQDELQAAYSQIIGALKGVWAQVDPQRLDPQSMQTIKWLTAIA